MTRALVALALLALPAAAKPRLAVVDVAAPPTMLGLGSQVTQTVLNAAREQKLQVIPPDEVREALGEQAYAELVRCGGKPACVTLKLGRLDVDRVVVGSLQRDERSYLVQLYLVDVRNQRVVTEVDRAILIASRRLAQDVSAAVPGLLRGEQEARGTLIVTSNVKKAKVSVNGEHAGQTPLTLSLKPGKHELTLAKSGHLSVTRLITVEPERETRELIKLLLIPGAIAEEEPEDAAPSETATASAGGGLKVPPAAWIALGAGVAAGGVGAVFGAAAGRTEKSVSESYDPVTDTYGATRRTALEGQKSALIANVLYGVAGAAAVTAVVLTLFQVGVEAEAPPVTAGAAWGEDGVGVVVRGSF